MGATQKVGRSRRRTLAVQDRTRGWQRRRKEQTDSEAELTALGDGFDVEEQGKRGQFLGFQPKQQDRITEIIKD